LRFGDACERVAHEPCFGGALRIVVDMLQLAATAPVPRVVHAGWLYALAALFAQRNDAAARETAARLQLNVNHVAGSGPWNENGKPFVATHAVPTDG
jgi:hypothetical protein